MCVGGGVEIIIYDILFLQMFWFVLFFPPFFEHHVRELNTLREYVFFFSFCLIDFLFIYCLNILLAHCLQTLRCSV